MAECSSFLEVDYTIYVLQLCSQQAGKLRLGKRVWFVGFIGFNGFISVINLYYVR
jgi:hypothetical protein